ncbi:hypothetical protein B5S33_g4627 [[Candida] boidinii]|nr:hypothetical protein B5S30_g4156 [[Candida] boidinii]OWB85951.1 hypothetical protein B5S33_g4627 [[Candida] boidinii]GMG08717.1 unnamed protein product [[Candida] boidinii]
MGFICPGIIVKINDRNEYDLRSEKKHSKKSSQNSKGKGGGRNTYSSETSKFLKRYAELYPDNKILREMVGSDLSEFQNHDKRRKLNNGETLKQNHTGIIDSYNLQETGSHTPILSKVNNFTDLPLEILTKIMILSDNFESLILTNKLLHDIIENQKNYLMFENIKHCYLHIFDLATKRKTSFNYGISRRRVTNEDGHDHIANALITKLDRRRRATMHTRKDTNKKYKNGDSMHMNSLISNSGSEEVEQDDSDEEVEASDTESDSDSDSDIQSETSTVISISEENGGIHPLHTSPYRVIVLDDIVFRRKHFMNFKILDALSIDLILSSTDIEKLKLFASKFKALHNSTKTTFLKDFKEKNKPLIQFPFIEDYHRRQIKVKDKMRIIDKIINMDSIFMQKIETILEYIISHDHKQIITLSTYQKLIDQNLDKLTISQTVTQGEDGAEEQREVRNQQDETSTDNVTTTATTTDADDTNHGQNETNSNRITYLKSTDPLVNAIRKHNWGLVELLVNYYDKNILSNDDSLWEFIVESKNWKYIQKLESVGINPSSEVLSILARLHL